MRRKVYWADSDQFAASKTEGWSILVDASNDSPLMCWQPTSQGYPRPCLAGCVAIAEDDPSTDGELWYHTIYCKAMSAALNDGALMPIGDVVETRLPITSSASAKKE